MPQENPEFGEPEFMGWLLLNKLKSRSDQQISRSKFLKLCCLTDRELLDVHDHDVGLARYWYMYGELASEHEFSGRFYYAPRAIGWEGQRYIPKNDLQVDDFDVPHESLEVIYMAVRDVVNEFGDVDVESIKEHQYEHHAENEFIQEYSELRWFLKTVYRRDQRDLGEWGGGQTNEEYIASRLNAMLDAYPDVEDGYDEMKSLYLRWDDTVRMMLDQSVEYSRIEEFLDDFIEVLSKVVLRFNYNRHIPEERLADWREDAADARSAFATELRETRQELLRDRSRSTELDAVSEAYSQSIEEQIERITAGE